MLDDFQKPSQYYRARARTDSDAQHRQPKARRPRLQESRGYPTIIGLSRMI